MLRRAILAASRSSKVKTVVAGAPVSRSVVARFVAGETNESAVAATAQLLAEGLTVTLDHLGEDTLDAGQAAATVKTYLEVIAMLGEAGHAADGRAEVSLKLSAVGQAIDEQMALDNARADLRGGGGRRHHGDPRHGGPHHHRLDPAGAGGAAQGLPLHRRRCCRATCTAPRPTAAALATEGSRMRLCKGAYKQPESVAYQSKAEVDASYGRCLDVLMAGKGYPMVASHDPAIVAFAGALATKYGRAADTFEYQMLYGIRPDEQARLAAEGNTVRVYVPYGDEWYGYLMRRLAERPANLTFFLRALLSRG